MDLGLLILDENDNIQSDPAMNRRPLQTGNSPEAVELRNDSEA